MGVLKTWHRAALVFALALLVFAAFAYHCLRNPNVNFLPGHRGANWIIFPSAVDTSAHPVAYIDATFRRVVTLEKQPRTAQLTIAAFKRFHLKINGASAETGKINNWKNVSTVDVLPLLRTGTNVIEVQVFNNTAPPSLWLTLTTDETTLRTDQSWEASFAGSTSRPVVRASTPRFPGPGNPVAAEEQTIQVVRNIWPIWIGFTGIALVVWLAVRWQLNRLPKSAADARSGSWSRTEIAILILFAGLWIVLFWNNGQFITRYGGFDARSHLDYVQYIQERRTLPLPTEGFEMSHPPLYYALSAGALSACGLTVNDTTGILVLRWLTMAIGIAHFVLIFLSLRLLFPNQSHRHFAGVLLAAFLPMQLYLCHYVTNETLTATLIAAAIYFALRVLKITNARLSNYVWLGFFLGAAMLTKVTGALLLPPLFVALTIKLLVDRPSVTVWLRTLGVPFSICFVLCSWYYIWIWHHFGTPLVVNFNTAVTGLAWWQDAGYHTATDFVRFGRSLVRPFFSGFAGIPDGIYSTLWGDGLWGGLSDVASRTPWNYGLMTGGYLLAIVPTILILTGAGAALYNYLRGPSTEWFLLFGFCALVICVFLLNTLAGSFAQIKAFYASSALTPFCCFVAIGWDALTHGRKRLEFILGTVLLVWAMNSFASMWVRESAPQHVYNAARWQFEHNLEATYAEATKAVAADPTNEMPYRFLSVVATQSGRFQEAAAYAQRAAQLAPLTSDTHMQLSAVLMKQGQLESAVSEARRALELGPENGLAYNVLFTCLLELQRIDQAINVARDALAVSPSDADLHYRIGLAAGGISDFTTAAHQLAYALLLRPNVSEIAGKLHLAVHLAAQGSDAPSKLKAIASSPPDSPPLLNELAWLFATHPNAAVRDGLLAVQLSERACALTEHKQPVLLASAAAAYAEVGKFSEAIATAQNALSLARLNGDAKTAGLAENLLTSFQSNQPYREEPRL
ncbi:MAG TPA: glycosyltransferase family 39 protein [Chthoniobacterales bacterium]|jgi:tetratricopeptide (TPR) repeat protein|nr:glycosyltransferase family 39 protein [Chthoniobacterales bacterium]